MLVSTSWLGLNSVGHGFDRSTGRLCRVSWMVNSRYSNCGKPTFITPACLNRILSTAEKHSIESMKPRWKGAIFPKASRSMTSFWSKTCGGTAFFNFSILSSSCTLRTSSFYSIRNSKHCLCSSDRLSSISTVRFSVSIRCCRTSDFVEVTATCIVPRVLLWKVMWIVKACRSSWALSSLTSSFLHTAHLIFR